MRWLRLFLMTLILTLVVGASGLALGAPANATYPTDHVGALCSTTIN
ncbi:MAG: hypothetical protein AB1609_19010 [Bacillota bacterium]